MTFELMNIIASSPAPRAEQVKPGDRSITNIRHGRFCRPGSGSSGKPEKNPYSLFEDV